MSSATVPDSDSCVIEEKDTLEGRPEGLHLRKEETELLNSSQVKPHYGILHECGAKKL
jgi:hypothetical protein